jgi:HSP20 family molecular chaperone IbpA
MQSDNTNNLLFKRINSPKVDLMQIDDKYIVKVEVPGVTNLECKLEHDQILLVFGERNHVFPEGTDFIYREIRFGKFVRRVKLPSKVILDDNTLNQTPIDGVITLEFVKKEELETIPEEVN